MANKPPKRRFLALDEISPSVDVVSCHKFERSYWFRYRLPSHHLLLVESGRIEARTPDGTFHGKAGDLFCFRPTDRNEFGTIGPTLFYEAAIRFAPPPRHQFTPSLAEFGPLPVKVSLGRAFQEMRGAFETLCTEIPHSGASHQLRLRAVVHEILATAASVLTRDGAGWRHLDEWQRLRMRLDAELDADFSVEAMAGQMNLSRSYFNRTFKKRFGVTPKAYHRHARLQEAARLLRSTDKSVKAVAYELGFPDAKVFARLFKSQLGVLPSDIRLGTASAPKETPSVGGRLFPMNQHIVPPQAGANWIARYALKRRGPGGEMMVEWKPKARA